MYSHVVPPTHSFGGSHGGTGRGRGLGGGWGHGFQRLAYGTDSVDAKMEIVGRGVRVQGESSTQAECIKVGEGRHGTRRACEMRNRCCSGGDGGDGDIGGLRMRLRWIRERKRKRDGGGERGAADPSSSCSELEVPYWICVWLGVVRGRTRDGGEGWGW